MTAIAILYEDGEALVIDKPAGLPLDCPRAGGESLDDHLEALKLGFQRAFRAGRDGKASVVNPRVTVDVEKHWVVYNRKL